MEEGQEVTNEVVLLRKRKQLEDYAAARTKLQRLQDTVRAEAEVLGGLVGYLKRGGDCSQISKTLELYLTYTLANLIRDMWAVCIAMDEVERRLSGLGTVPN